MAGTANANLIDPYGNICAEYIMVSLYVAGIELLKLWWDQERSNGGIVSVGERGR